MTIKWVQQDPLVMNGEPFCYNSRLTVRQLLELRANGYDLTRVLTDHPELRVVGVAAAYAFAADHRERYADFFEADGSLIGPGYTDAEAAWDAAGSPQVVIEQRVGAADEVRAAARVHRVGEDDAEPVVGPVAGPEVGERRRGAVSLHGEFGGCERIRRVHA